VKSGIIGIVGGMGPGAGIDLSSKIVSQTLAASDQEHLPQLLFSFPSLIGDRTRFVLGQDSENPGPRIAGVVLRLEQAGATVAGLACNSAHIPAIFGAIQDELNRHGARIRLLHMIDEVGRFIREHHPGISRVGVLGTTGTYVSGLYDMLEDHGLNVVNVSERTQASLHSAIYHPEWGIKSVGPNQRAVDVIIKAADTLRAKRAGLVVFGCTEFPLAYRDPAIGGLPVVDSSLVLARALVRHIDPAKLYPLGPGLD